MKKKYLFIILSAILKTQKHRKSFLIFLFAVLGVQYSFAQTISSFSPTSACSNSGTTVTISGAGFTGVTSVTFSGTSATYTVDSVTQITATLPAGAITGLISVTTSMGPASSGTSFTVNPNLTPSVSIVATPSTTVCSGSSVTFTANPSNGGSTPTYVWKLVSNLVTSTVGSNSPTYTTTALSNEDKVYVEMTSNATCPSPDTVTSNILTMTVNPLLIPTINISASNLDICSGTTVNFTSTTPTNGGLNPSYQWQISTDGGANFDDIGSATSDTYSTNGLSDGNIIRLKFTSSATCATPRIIYTSGLNVKVKNPPTIANAGTDQIICGTSTSLTANNAISGVGNWSIISGIGGTVTNPTTPNSSFSGVSGSTYLLRWTISNSPCTASTDDVSITFKANPTTSDAGTDQILCGTTTTLSGNNPTTGAGSWTIISGVGGSLTTISSPSSTFSGVAGTTYVLQWSITNAPCPPSTDQVSITFTGIPTVANAGIDQTLCGNSTSLAANTPGTGTGTWSIISGTGGSITTPSSASSGFTGTAGTTYQLRWTISNAPCTASADDVTISFKANPTTATAGPDQTGAGTCGLLSVTLAGNNPAIGIGQWTVVSGTGGSFANASLYNTSFSGTAGNSYTLRWTITNAPCAATFDEVDVTFNRTPAVANAGPDQSANTTCGATTVTLAANNPPIGTGSWSVVSGVGGSFGSTSVYNTSFSGIAGAAYTLRWTISNAPCTSSSDDVNITFNQNPTTANAGPNQTGAATCGSTSVTLAANNPLVGIGSWTIISGAGGSFGNASLYNSIFTGTAGTTYVLRWTISNAPCNASTSEVTISFSQNPTIANAGPNQTSASTCGLTSVTLAANSPVIGTGGWSIVSGAGGSFGNAASPSSTFSGIAGTTYVLRWTITTSSCGNSQSDVTITFNQRPVPTFTTIPLSPFCVNENHTYSTQTGQSNYVWTVPGTAGVDYTIVSGGIGTGSNTVTLKWLTAGSKTVTVNYTNAAGCTGSSVASNTTSVNPNATIALTSAATTTLQNVCRLSAITNITYAVTGATTISSSTGLPAGVNAVLSAGVLTISGSPTAAVAAGTYNYTVTTAGPCVNVSASGSIVVWAGTPSGWNGSSSISISNPSICPPANNITITAPSNANNVQYYDWILPSGWTITSNPLASSISVSVTTAAQTGNQVVTVRAVNSCGNISTSSPANGKNAISVDTFTGVTASPPTQSVCSGSSISVTGTLTGNATSGTWTAPSGTFTPMVISGSNPITVSSTYTPSITSGNVTLTITTNTPTGCSTQPGTATVDLTVNQPSVAPTNLGASISTICNGSSTILTQTGGSLGTGAVWKWYSNSAYTTVVGTSASTDASLSVTPSTTTTYYLRAESTTGAPCTANVAAAGSITVTVNQASVAPTALIGTPNTICNGNSTTLTQTGGTLGTGASWHWYSDVSFTTLVGTSATANASLSVSPTTTTTYYLRAESTTGAPCAANVAAAGSVIITVNQSSVAPTNLSAAVSPICNGSSTTVTQNGGSLGTGASWKWYSNSGFTTLVGTTTTADASLSVSPSATTTYYLRAESTTGTPCTANVPAAGSVTVIVNQTSVAPTALIGTPNTICNGNSTTLTQTGGSLGTGASWKWYSDASFTIPVGTNAIANASLSVSPSTTTTYYLRAESTTATPCLADVAAAASVTITVNQPSVAPTSLNASVSPVCNGSSTIITQTGGSLGTGASWKWYSNSGLTTLVGTSTTADASLSVSPSATTTYYLRAESTTGTPCTANIPAVGSVTVTVNQTSVAPTALVGTPNTICNGNSTTLTQTGGSLGTGASWNWYSDASYTTLVGSSATANAGLSVSPTTTTTYYLRAESTTGAPCEANVASAGIVTITVNQNSAAPTSLSATVSTICNGSSTALTQTGGSLGTGAIWKWYSNSGFTTLVGTSTTADANLSVSPSATVTYYLRAESTTGTPCTANVPAVGSVTVTVNQTSVAPTALVGTPNTICNGNSTTLTQTGGSLGTGASWKWYSDASFTIPVGTSAVANASLSVSPSTTTTYYLRAESTTGAPCLANVNAAVSVTITVNNPVVISTQPAASQTLCAGNSATFNVLATGTGLNYQWRKGTTNLIDGGNIDGATSPTLTISNLQTADAANNYNVVITGTNPCSTVTSANSILIVNRLVAINTQPSNVGVCASSPATLGLIASGDGLTYQWYKGTIGSGVALVNSSNINGANSNILNFVQVSLTDNGPYYAIVSGISPCATVTSNQVTLNVDQSIIITSQPVTQSVCEDTANVSFSVTANAGGDPLTYQWRKNGGNISGATTSSFTIPTATLLSAGNYDVLITGPSGYTCSSVTSTAAVLTVKPKPIGSAIAQTVCSDSSTNVSLNSTVSGSTFTWTAAIQTAPTGGTINGHSDSSGLSIVQALKNTGTTAGIIRYTVIPTANSCVGPAFTVDVTVNPAPVGSATAQTICSGSTTSVALNSTVIGTTFTWSAAIHTAPADGTINGFSSGTENTISQTLTNNGTTAGIIRYTVTPTADSCTGNSFTVDVTVNPNSTIVLSSVSGSDNTTECVNTNLNISYTIGGGGTNASITAGGLPAGITGSYDTGTRVFTIEGNPTAVGTFTYTVTTQGICSNESLSGTITVDEDSKIILSLGTGSDNQTKCINSPITPIKYTIENGGDNPTISGNIETTGITGSYDVSAGVYTISGTPSVSGTFNYTVTTAGKCINSSLSGTIVVNPEPEGSATAQTICSDSATTVALISNLSNTTFNWTAAVQSSPVGGTITGFSDNSGNTIVETLSNTGTTPAIVRYTVTPTANSCPGSSFTVDVTVNPTAQVNQPSSQIICHSLATSAINFVTNNSGGTTTYTWINNNPSIGLASSGTGNIPSFTATNTGTSPATATIVVTPTYNNGNINCSGPSKTFTIIVNANSTMNLSSATGTNTQTICIDNPISSITYVIGGGGTGASITSGSLPTGVTGFYNAGVFTISGTPSVSGTYNYTLTTSGPCSNVSLTGSIIITALPIATFTYPAAAYCITSSNPVPSIPLGSQAGNFTSTTGLSIASATGLINLAASTAGTYTVINTIPAAGGCPAVSASTTVRIDPIPIGGILSFGATGRIFLSCIDPAPNATVVVANQVKLDLTAMVGSIVKWEYRTSAASSWSVIPDGAGNFTGTSLSASQINNLKITASTVFRVEISSGACTPNVYSETAIISVIPTDIKPSPVAVNKKVICIGEGVQLSSETGYGESFGKFEGGAFDNSSITEKGWRITDQAGTTGYNFSSNADNIRPDKWLRTNPHDFITANTFTPYTIYNTRWDTSLSSAGNKGFAIVSGNNTSTLETAIFSLAALDEAILTFDQAYNLTPGAVIRVEISTNGGASYSSEPILFQQSGAVSSGNYDRFGQGTPGVNQMEIDLGDYIGYSNLRIRFNFIGKRDGDVWTLDNIKVPEGPRDVNLVWTDYTDPANPIVIGTTNNVTWTPTKIGWNTFVVKTSLILDSAGNTCSSPVNQEEIKVFAFDQYTTTTVASAVGCGTKIVPLSATVVGGKQGSITSYPTPDGYVGEWSIQGPAGFVLSNSNPSATIDPKNNPNAIFTAANIGDYTFTWILVPTTKDENGLTIININCTPNYVAPTLILQHCTTLDFDGIDDYVDLGTGYTETYSIEAWIRPKTLTGTIISGPQFEVKMTDLPPGIATNSRWYHIAVSDGKIYVDGIEMKNAGTGTGGTKAIIGARWNNSSGKPENYFTGWIEEVRIWNKTITPEQIRFMMNQHLQNAANIGIEIPIPVEGGLVYSDLAGYYRLISENPDPDNLETFSNALKPATGLTPDLGLSGRPGVLYNMTTHQQNTAPMPYISKANGKWTNTATWLRPTVWDIPNSNGLNGSPIEWNIAVTSHDITSDAKDITLLGLKSESGKLTMAEPSSALDENNSGQGLWITHYLKLNGNIDLVGESQLVQKKYGAYNSDSNYITTQFSESIFDPNSTGYIKRDQQGQQSSFNYNYWSSPVSVQGSDNNADYSLSGVLRDGSTSSNPISINFVDGAFSADAANSGTDPIKITNRWIWAFNSPALSDPLSNYNQWRYMGSTGFIKTGEGYTMKGTGGIAPYNARQNYAFIGKPHSGDVLLNLGVNQTYLVGNPYPSSIDANEFIKDNLNDCMDCRATSNLFSGAIYFWDHFGLSNNHYLAEYEGGYATYTMAGAAPAINNSPLTANDGVSGTYLPRRYIPVAQGFFVNAYSNSTAPTVIKFQNTQREFVRESPTDSRFMKLGGTTKSAAAELDTRLKIRLGFDSTVGAHRQLLVTADTYSTNQFDIGYDAPMIDTNKNDMYWELNNSKLIIQAVPDFNVDQIIPLGIVVAKAGDAKIKIDALENIPQNLSIYLYDELTGSYHDIKKKEFPISLEVGQYNNRFSLRFTDRTLSVDDFELSEGILVYFKNTEKVLNIENNLTDAIINKVYLFNMLGQSIADWDVKERNQTDIKIPIKNVSSGVYIVKIKTTNGDFSKKIIIK